MPDLLLSSICVRTEENVETVNDSVLSQEDKLQTHRTIHEISREMGIHRLSVFQIICKDLHLKCFKRRRGQELTDANRAARMKRAKLLLQKFPQCATDLVFKKVFLVTSPASRQNKVSGRLRELLKKKLSILFCADTVRSAMPGRVFTVRVSRNFLNSLLTPLSVKFLMKFVCQTLCCVPFQIQTLYQNLVLVA